MARGLIVAVLMVACGPEAPVPACSGCEDCGGRWEASGPEKVCRGATCVGGRCYPEPATTCAVVATTRGPCSEVCAGHRDPEEREVCCCPVRRSTR